MIERGMEGGSVKTRVCEGNTYAARDEWGEERKEAGRKKSELIVRNGPLRGRGGRGGGGEKGGKMKRSARDGRWKGGGCWKGG